MVPVGGATLQLFYVPILRHFWYWLGVRRADRATMNQLLSEGTSVVLCPGGVQVRHAIVSLCKFWACSVLLAMSSWNPPVYTWRAL